MVTNRAVNGGRILVLAGGGRLSKVVCHALFREFESSAEVRVVVEDPPSKIHILRRRLKRLGALTVLGQVLFSVLAVPVLSRIHRARIEDIQRTYEFDRSAFGSEVIYVSSVNDCEVANILHEFDPDVVVVFGTRIIGKKILRHVRCPILNTHMGITPAYRGVHGGYWALADRRPDLVGATVHRVDEGIDTGDVVEQVYINVTDQDSFVTYPYLQLAAGLPALFRAIWEALGGTLKSLSPPEVESSLKYHPTLWKYVHTWIQHGVK